MSRYICNMEGKKQVFFFVSQLLHESGSSWWFLYKKIMDFRRAGKIIENCSERENGTVFERSIRTYKVTQKWLIQNVRIELKKHQNSISIDMLKVEHFQKFKHLKRVILKNSATG